MGRGILYLAFGKEFDKLTAWSACYSRQFTKLPIRVLTNLLDRSLKWKDVSNATFQLLNIPSNQNRSVKVSLIEHSPFEETLFMDSDAVIQKHGIESLFDNLKLFDLCCQYFSTICSEYDRNFERDFVKKTYHKLMLLLKESYPIDLFGEAALLFNKSDFSRAFFGVWKRYWKMMGSARDMPAFSFAVKHLIRSIKVFRGDVKFCTNAENEDFFIQHKGFNGFEKKFGLPSYIDWSPKL